MSYINPMCGKCVHCHYHTEPVPYELYDKPVSEFLAYQKSIPCTFCMYNYLEDHYEEALKPCPFCGSEAAVAEISDDYGNVSYVVRCSNPNCLCDLGEYNNKEQAYRSWNRRAKK